VIWLGSFFMWAAGLLGGQKKGSGFNVFIMGV